MTEKKQVGPTYTTMRKDYTVVLREAEYDYSAGKRGRVLKDTVRVDLHRAERFDPVVYCQKLEAKGYQKGEIKPEEVIEKLNDRLGRDIILWENRPRDPQLKAFEKENQKLRDERDSYQEAIAQAKSLEELKKKLGL